MSYGSLPLTLPAPQASGPSHPDLDDSGVFSLTLSFSGSDFLDVEDEAIFDLTLTFTGSDNMAGMRATFYEYGDALQRRLRAEGGTSGEIVGNLNELNSTEGVEYQESYDDWISS